MRRSTIKKLRRHIAHDFRSWPGHTSLVPDWFRKTFSSVRYNYLATKFHDIRGGVLRDSERGLS